MLSKFHVQNSTFKIPQSEAIYTIVDNERRSCNKLTLSLMKQKLGKN